MNSSIKKHGIQLYYQQEKKLVGSLVTIALPVSGINAVTMKQLINCKNIEGCDCTHGFDISAVAAATHSLLASKFKGSAESATKYQVSGLNFGYSEEHLIITVETAASGSAIRKLARELLSSFKPKNTKSIYKDLCKGANIKADSDSFAAAVARLTNGLAAPNILVITKSGLSDEKLEAIVEKIADKLKTVYEKQKEETKMRKLESPSGETHHNCSGKALADMNSVIAYTYASAKKAPVTYAGNKIYWPSGAKLDRIVDPGAIETFATKLKDKEDKSVSGLKIYAAREAMLTPRVIYEIKKISPSDIAKAINSMCK
jgi:hypothetical protein